MPRAALCCGPLCWLPMLQSWQRVPALAVGSGGWLEEAAWCSMTEAGSIPPAANEGEHSKVQTVEGCWPFVSVASQNNQVSHPFSILRNLGNTWVPTVAEGPAQSKRYQVPVELSPAAEHIAQLFLLLPSKALMKLLVEPFYFGPVQNSWSCLSPAKYFVSEEIFGSS